MKVRRFAAQRIEAEQGILSMFSPCAPLPSIAVMLSASLAAASANAACSSRPGTPNDLRTEAVSADTIRLYWINRTRSEDLMFFDVEIRGDGGDNRDISGSFGRQKIKYGTEVSATLQKLRPNNRYCFRVRARTEAGKEGCTSLAWSLPECAKTRAPRLDLNPDCAAYTKRALDALNLARIYKCDPKLITGPRWSSSSDEHMTWCVQVSPAARQAEADARTKTVLECRAVAKRAALPTITVQWLKGDVFLIKGLAFTPNAPVTIDVSGGPTTLKSLTVDSHNTPIVARADGSLYALLAGVCNSGRSGTVQFAARDKDRTAARPVTATCRSGAEYEPNRKIRP